MLTKKIFISFFACLCLATVSGQEIIIRPGIGMGTYAMSDLKDLMEQSANEFVVGLKSMDKFPPYAFYQLDVLCQLVPNFAAGVSSAFYSTGARNHYADYSGSYREDLLVNAINLGGIFSWQHDLGNQFSLSLELASGIKFSNIDIDSKFIITDEYKEAQTYSMKSSSWWAAPQIRIERTVWQALSVSAFGGYEINPGSKIETEDYAGQYLRKQNGDYIKINWTGLRAGLSASWAFKF